MKKQIVLLTVVAAALIATPTVIRAEEPSAGKHDTNAPAKKHEKHGSIPFHGKVSAVDAAGATLTLKELTLNVTSDTKITKDGKPATLADITVGAAVHGSYKKDEAGKANALTIAIGEKEKGKAKGEEKKKKDGQ